MVNITVSTVVTHRPQGPVYSITIYLIYLIKAYGSCCVDGKCHCKMTEWHNHIACDPHTHQSSFTAWCGFIMDTVLCLYFSKSLTLPFVSCVFFVLTPGFCKQALCLNSYVYHRCCCPFVARLCLHKGIKCEYVRTSVSVQFRMGALTRMCDLVKTSTLLHNQIMPVFIAGMINGLGWMKAESAKDSFGFLTVLYV